MAHYCDVAKTVVNDLSDFKVGDLVRCRPSTVEELVSAQWPLDEAEAQAKTDDEFSRKYQVGTVFEFVGELVGVRMWLSGLSCYIAPFSLIRVARDESP